MSLLVCIVFHHSKVGEVHLNRILDAFQNEYKTPVSVIIDTNTQDIWYLNRGNVKVVVHDNLEHPFHLTWMHRSHIKEAINDYDTFMYVEHDMYVPYINYLNYLDNFKILFPDYIPSFVRIEEKDGEKYCIDIIRGLQKKLVVTKIRGKDFTVLGNMYHAFWIMPKQELLSTLSPDFVRVSEKREDASSYPRVDLNKVGMVEIENELISEKCFAYHLTNNYVEIPHTRFGKIKLKDIFLW